MLTQALKRFSARRMRILWIVLAALLLVSVTPLWLYHRQVLNLSEEKLQDAEQVQQNETTRSIASETLQFEQNVHDQLTTQRQVLTLTGWIQDVDDPTVGPEIARLLQEFAQNNPNILYVTAINKQAKGQSAGSFAADQDPFVDAALKRGYQFSYQGIDYLSPPFALGQDEHPALVMSVPLMSGGQFSGMLAAVVSLNQLETRLREVSVRHRVVFIVNADGHMVAYPDTRELVPGRDVTSMFPLVKQFKELPRLLRATSTPVAISASWKATA